MDKEHNQEGAPKHQLEEIVIARAEEHAVTLGKRLHTGKWYDGKIRSVVTEGVMRAGDTETPVVVKAYEDPRPCNQPGNLEQFNADNKSALLHAPQLIAGEATSDTAGWMIMERIPQDAVAFQAPLEGEDVTSFLTAFAEYRRNFPRTPNRELLPQEQLDASEFHVKRINRWKGYALESDSVHLLTADLKTVCDAAETFVATYYAEQPMVWSHGHMKPDEVHRVQRPGQPDEYWVTDFGHTALYPRGYEFAFLAWANEVMHKRYDSADQLIQQFDEWAQRYAEVVGEIDPLDPAVIRAALSERLLGTIYADTIAQTTLSDEEKARRLPILIETVQRLIAE